MSQREIPKRQLVVLENGTIAGMASNSAFLKEFPFLNTINAQSKTKKGCGSCGRTAAAKNDVFSAVKQTIAGLDSDKKRKLKEMLNAQKVRVIYKNNAAKIVELTF